uniref:Uncharacterized protein n=1 Tax=Mimiviridae sp. ChoanoV1 TaxID=2596887 RepID=A0A5B8HWE8_9VIRU|nr:hypothetical protein 3_42 [Mimiviridae sp. ChoanoV1]
MAKTKRFNSNYRKNFKGGSRKRIPKKGKRRLNKSKSTKRRYKKSKINRQLRNKRLQKGGGETDIRLVFEVNKENTEIIGLWFYWKGEGSIGKKAKGHSLCKIKTIDLSAGKNIVKYTIEIRREAVLDWFRKKNFFMIMHKNYIPKHKKDKPKYYPHLVVNLGTGENQKELNKIISAKGIHLEKRIFSKDDFILTNEIQQLSIYELKFPEVLDQSLHNNNLKAFLISFNISEELAGNLSQLLKKTIFIKSKSWHSSDLKLKTVDLSNGGEKTSNTVELETLRDLLKIDSIVTLYYLHFSLHPKKKIKSTALVQQLITDSIDFEDSTTDLGPEITFRNAIFKKDNKIYCLKYNNLIRFRCDKDGKIFFKEFEAGAELKQPGDTSNMIVPGIEVDKLLTDTYPFLTSGSEITDSDYTEIGINYYYLTDANDNPVVKIKKDEMLVKYIGDDYDSAKSTQDTIINVISNFKEGHEETYHFSNICKKLTIFKTSGTIEIHDQEDKIYNFHKLSPDGLTDNIFPDLFKEKLATDKTNFKYIDDADTEQDISVILNPMHRHIFFKPDGTQINDFFYKHYNDVMENRKKEIIFAVRSNTLDERKKYKMYYGEGDCNIYLKLLNEDEDKYYKIIIQN